MRIYRSIKKIISERLEKSDVVDRKTFQRALLDITTLELEDGQVRYPNIRGKKRTYLFGGASYDLYLLDRDELPSSGPFEMVIESSDEVIGFIRGIKRGEVVSFKLIHIKEEHRGAGIGTDIYENFLDDGYIIKSDEEISDATFSLYSNLNLYGYKPLMFADGRVGLKK